MADTGNNRVEEYTTAGVFEKTIGVSGTNGPGQLESPAGLAMGPDGNLYVADNGNSRIDVFNPTTGNSIRVWSYQFPGTNGLVFDPNGHLLLETSGLGTQVYDMYGNLQAVYSFSIFNSYPPEFAFDTAGNLYGAAVNPTTGLIGVGKAVPCSLTPVPTPTLTPGPTPCETFEASWAGYNGNAFNSPTGIAVDPNSGNLYLAESGGKNRIDELDSTGGFQYQWGTTGSATGQFNNLAQLAVDGTAHELYAVDSGNNRVQVFDMSGNFKRTFGAAGNAPGDLNLPLGIALDGKGDVFVSDFANDRVEEYATAGIFIKTIGKGFGTEPGQLDEPRGLALGPDGNLYVVEAGGASGSHSRVSVFNPGSGAWVRALGTGLDLFSNPYMAAFDANGYLWICDPGSTQIRALDVYGDVITTYTGPDFYQVAFNGAGGFYATDDVNQVVQKWDRCGTVPLTLTPTDTPRFTPTSTNTPTPTSSFTPGSPSATPTPAVTAC
ncbi:MAG TPA: NHL repeat-containing protein, partial [bacterium]|nr:NHL repeat-containing protein [bacterium]